jgi:pyruvate,water dikinase
LKRWFLGIFYQRARQFSYYRDWISSSYTLGFGHFRTFYIELGKRFAQSSILKDKEDIFYLYKDEIEKIVSEESDSTTVMKSVDRRKLEIKKYQNIQLPEIIFGDVAPPIIESQAERLVGTATSPGIYSGPAKIARGVRDFSKINEGDVLIIPYSDVGWTPLFANAGAVVAESGGLLSHSSIIAREYGIPAVVSVQGALDIPENVEVTVDGYRGEVILSKSVVEIE